MPKILMRRDTLANWRSINPTLLAGEWGFETDTKRIKIGNGVDAYNDLDYWRESDNVWEPEAEWIDMRSACLPNSIYFLVAHGNATESSGTYSISLYPTFGVSAVLSGGDGSTYDVFVDGLKVGTYASGNDAILDWEALYNADKVEDAFAITYPATLMSHVVRVTPTNSAHTFTQIGAGKGITEDDSGLIWVHVSTNARISYNSFLDTADNGNPLLEAVTANDNVLYCSNLNSAFRGNAGLKSVPVIDGADESELDIDEAFKGCTAMKRVTFQNVDSNSIGTFDDCTNLKVINGDGCTFNPDFNNVPALKALPGTMQVGPDRTEISLSNVAGLKDTALDFSSESQLDKLTITGNDNQNAGLIGLTVSSDAEFGSLIEPQIDIHNTNMSRSALVGLFESMPYNVSYEKVGNPTIVDGVVSGFSKSDYLALPSLTNDFIKKLNQSSEIGIKLTTPIEEISQYAVLAFFIPYIGTGSGFSFYKEGKKIRWTILSNYYIETPSFNDGDTVWLKGVRNNGIAELLYSTDGTSYTSAGTLDISNAEDPSAYGNNAIPKIGINGNLVDGWRYTGSIDLNHTYIKVNDQLWFGPGATRNMKPAGNIVGSPTIVDGVMTYSNVSNYVRTRQNFLYSYNDYEIVCKCAKRLSTEEIIYCMSTGNNGNLQARLLSNAFRFIPHTFSNYIEIKGTFATDVWYWFKVRRTGNTIYASYSTDGVSWSNEVSKTFTQLTTASNFIAFGTRVVSDSSWNGTSIDLNETYIKVNDQYWYRGMTQATKRISVAGCSGTSALSPEDKAIVTDKNWALTLS